MPGRQALGDPGMRFHRRKREDHLREHLIMQLSAAHAFELPLRKQWVHGGAR